MAIITMTTELREALRQWNIGQVDRGIVWDNSWQREDGRFDVEVDDEITARLDQLRNGEESDEAVLWRAIGQPGTMNRQ